MYVNIHGFVNVLFVVINDGRDHLMSCSSVPIKEGMVEKRGHNAKYLIFSKCVRHHIFCDIFKFIYVFFLGGGCESLKENCCILSLMTWRFVLPNFVDNHVFVGKGVLRLY